MAVAGKTGTAEVPKGDPHAWFVAYAPAEAPQLAIAVIVEHGGAGADAAAPLCKQVIATYFGIEQPPPPTATP